MHLVVTAADCVECDTGSSSITVALRFISQREVKRERVIERKPNGLAILKPLVPDFNPQ